MLIFFSMLFVCGLILLVTAIALRVKKHEHSNIVVLFASILILAGVIGVPTTFISHGATVEDVLSHGIDYAVYHYENTPEDQSGIVTVKQEDGTIKDCVIAFYKFDCPDCTYSYKEIDNILKNSGKKYYWVESRSELGSQIYKDYGVWWVPSVVVCYDGNKVIQCNHRVEEDGVLSAELEDEFVNYFN